MMVLHSLEMAPDSRGTVGQDDDEVGHQDDAAVEVEDQTADEDVGQAGMVVDVDQAEFDEVNEVDEVEEVAAAVDAQPTPPTSRRPAPLSELSASPPRTQTPLTAKLTADSTAKLTLPLSGANEEETMATNGNLPLSDAYKELQSPDVSSMTDEELALAVKRVYDEAEARAEASAEARDKPQPTNAEAAQTPTPDPDTPTFESLTRTLPRWDIPMTHSIVDIPVGRRVAETNIVTRVPDPIQPSGSSLASTSPVSPVAIMTPGAPSPRRSHRGGHDRAHEAGGTNVTTVSIVLSAVAASIRTIYSATVLVVRAVLDVISKQANEYRQLLAFLLVVVGLLASASTLLEGLRVGYTLLLGKTLQAAELPVPMPRAAEPPQSIALARVPAMALHSAPKVYWRAVVLGARTAATLYARFDDAKQNAEATTADYIDLAAARVHRASAHTRHSWTLSVLKTADATAQVARSVVRLAGSMGRAISSRAKAAGSAALEVLHDAVRDAPSRYAASLKRQCPCPGCSCD